MPELRALLVGDWELTGFQFTDPDGGLHTIEMQGRLHYTGGGLMSAHLMSGFGPDRGAFSTTSYCGTFYCDGETVHHDVRISSVRNWIGTTLTRRCNHRGQEMTLIAENTRFREFTGTADLFWRRI